MRRLVGSSRKPKGMKIPPEMSHLALYWIGKAISPPAMSSTPAPSIETVTAVIDRLEESLGCLRVKIMINTKERKGNHAVSMVINKSISWRKDETIVTLEISSASLPFQNVIGVRIYRTCSSISTDNQGKSHGDLGSGHSDDKEYKGLSLQLVPPQCSSNESDARCVHHDFHTNQDHDQIAMRQDADKSQQEGDTR